MNIVKNLTFKFKNKTRGFTLIELLIVISIIGILTSLLTANYLSVQQRARDAQRKADLKQIQTALELYRADEGSYPTVNPFTSATCGNQFTGTLTPQAIYMQKIPCDAKFGAYVYTPSGGTQYSIQACAENGNDSSSILSTTISGCSKNFKYTNP